MIKKLNSIELLFENCSGCDIGSEYIILLEIEDVRTTKVFDRNTLDIIDSARCDRLYLIINKNVPDQELDFDDNKSSIIKRIHKHNDIVFITLNYMDGTKQRVYLQWEDENNNEEVNKLQSSTLTIDGNLIIEISK